MSGDETCMSYVQPIGSLNHIELFYRCGEANMVERILVALGCEVRRGDGWIIADERMFVTEISPEQDLVERWIDAHRHVVEGLSALVQRVREHPATCPHLGIGYEGLTDWRLAIDRIESLCEQHPRLKEGVEVVRVVSPGDAESYADNLHQAFVLTDVFGGGFLRLGQVIELQCYVG
jgi:hypothetical protein